ncbi:hypothetical protein VPH35_012344 [Triticum aestivum]
MHTTQLSLQVEMRGQLAPARSPINSGDAQVLLHLTHPITSQRHSFQSPCVKELNMAMRGNNVKTFVMMLVVVGVVAMEQTQQVQASHCCCDLKSVDTYFTCRQKSDSTVSDCCGASAGYISDAAGFECKPGYIDIETALQAVNYCKLGCTASLCNKVTPSGKDATERCTSGCHDLCTKNNAEIAQVVMA